MSDLIFDSKNYKELIEKSLDSARFQRGARVKLAEHLGTQPSFVSRVLSGTQDFSSEHMIRIASFLGQNQEESDYLILLHHRDRSGTKDLRAHYQKQIDRILGRRMQIKTKVLADRKTISDVDAMDYYGAWYHTAVHMLLRNSEMDLEAIANNLALSNAQIKESVRILEKLGMIDYSHGKWRVTDQRIHYSKKSPSLRTHHMNWRMSAMRSLDDSSENDLHYSLVMSVDATAIEKIKKIILESIKEIDPILAKADDREVHALTLDLFRVGRVR